MAEFVLTSIRVRFGKLYLKSIIFSIFLDAFPCFFKSFTMVSLTCGDVPQSWSKQYLQSQIVFYHLPLPGCSDKTHLVGGHEFLQNLK